MSKIMYCDTCDTEFDCGENCEDYVKFPEKDLSLLKTISIPKDFFEVGEKFRFIFVNNIPTKVFVKDDGADWTLEIDKQSLIVSGLDKQDD